MNYLRTIGEIFESVSPFRVTSLSLCDHETTIVVAERKDLPGTALELVKLYSVLGERNSGTTWISKLISDNTSPLILQKGHLTNWKHAKILPQDLVRFQGLDRTIFILCVKVQCK